jgi:hypothetical protein
MPDRAAGVHRAACLISDSQQIRARQSPALAGLQPDEQQICSGADDWRDCSLPCVQKVEYIHTATASQQPNRLQAPIAPAARRRTRYMQPSTECKPTAWLQPGTPGCCCAAAAAAAGRLPAYLTLAALASSTDRSSFDHTRCTSGPAAAEALGAAAPAPAPAPGAAAGGAAPSAAPGGCCSGNSGCPGGICPGGICMCSGCMPGKGCPGRPEPGCGGCMPIWPGGGAAGPELGGAWITAGWPRCGAPGAWGSAGPPRRPGWAAPGWPMGNSGCAGAGGRMPGGGPMPGGGCMCGAPAARRTGQRPGTWAAPGTQAGGCKAQVALGPQQGYPERPPRAATQSGHPGRLPTGRGHHVRGPGATGEGAAGGGAGEGRGGAREARQRRPAREGRPGWRREAPRVSIARELPAGGGRRGGK